uniref:S-formylglutathione hydrolase n=1 Tax=Timspurckia oligopyrenoides TaxID=708627 RepID=A0A7S0ZJH9_9RHOD|mmetsp:Transcript_7730/g.14038  ORF Transcript_7730/g.14038 Transcript_7730/m.14038 type:complete len:290 (+) Transcript_7730:42-911(+)
MAKLLSSVKCFSCSVERYEHISAVLGGLSAKFHVIFPPQVTESGPVPVLFWLSGLTCTDENYIIKAMAYPYVAKYGIAVVVPDTSPRGANALNEDEASDFGTGAGFYVNATTDDYKKHYNMDDYIVKELPELLKSTPEISSRLNMDRRSIFGHSMGGHGALVLALRNESMFRSVSAFAPICNPVKCPWGIKAFTGYLGDNIEDWKKYDATELLKSRGKPLYDRPILVDQGLEDQFYPAQQLLPESFQEACQSTGQKLELRFQEGYNHSYFFIATFMEDHIRYHSEALLE